jgi:hypothetical protein
LYIAEEQETNAMYEINTPLMLPHGKKIIMSMKAFKQYTLIKLDLAINSVKTLIFARKG